MRNLGSLTEYINQCCVIYTLPLSYIASFLLFVFNSHVVSYNGKNGIPDIQSGSWREITV